MKNSKKQKKKQKFVLDNRCKVFMVRSGNSLIENTNSVEGTFAEDISAEIQHKESTETHASRNKI